MTARRISFSLLLLLALPWALLACGGDDPKEVQGSNTTLTPPFPQKFESQTGLTVLYPEGWRVQEGEQGVYLANQDLVMSTLLDADGKEMPENGVDLIVLTPLTEAGYPGLVELEPAALVQKVAATLPDNFGGAQAKIGQVEDAKVGDYPAARVSITRPNQHIEGYLIAFKPQPDVALLALVQAREGTLADHESTVMEVLQNVTYGPPPAPPTATQPSVIGPPTTAPSSATESPAATATTAG